jgi:hypothetical protein
MQLTEHFSLEELTHSEVAPRRGLPNVPGPVEVENLKRIAATMELVRTLLKSNAIVVHSGYRAPDVNRAIGGVYNSAHCKGLACDFVCPGFGANLDVATEIQQSQIPFDQLILEYGWVHLGLADADQKPRLQCLTKRSASAPYEHGINV